MRARGRWRRACRQRGLRARTYHGVRGERGGEDAAALAEHRVARELLLARAPVHGVLHVRRRRDAGERAVLGDRCRREPGRGLERALLDGAQQRREALEAVRPEHPLALRVV